MANLTVNGKPYTVNVAPDTPLLWVIREHLQLTGTKFGCGTALCGACTVHLDGAAVRFCQVPVSQALKKSADYRVIGSWIPRLDIPEKTNGAVAGARTSSTSRGWTRSRSTAPTTSNTCQVVRPDAPAPISRRSIRERRRGGGRCRAEGIA